MTPCLRLPLLAILLWPALVSAQDMEPRSYSNAPVGLNFLLVSWIHSSGNVLFDASLPVEDVSAEVNTGILAYVRTIDVFGRSGKVAVLLPHVWADVGGLVAGERTSINRTGWADPRFRFSVNFLGAPALRRQEFAGYRQKTIVGATFQLTAPFGEFDDTKRINLGSNRWSFRPELGVSHRRGKWVLELSAGVAYFSDNDDFLGTSTLEQKPLTSVQGHLVYNFRPRLWVAFDAVHFRGGETAIDGVARLDLQTNSRSGVTLAVPLRRGRALKFLFSTGLTTRFGADFDSVGVAYQFSWD